MGVAATADHTVRLVANVEDRNVHGASTEVKNQDSLVLDRVNQTVRDRSGSRVTDEMDGVDTGDLSSIESVIALDVVVIGRHGNDGLADLAAKVCRRILHRLGDQVRHHFTGGKTLRSLVLLDGNLDVSLLRPLHIVEEFGKKGFELGIVVFASEESARPFASTEPYGPRRERYYQDRHKRA